MSDTVLAEILRQLQGLHEGLVQLNQGQAKLEQGQAKLEQGQAKLEQQQSDTRTGLMARMDRLQARIDQLSNEWFTAFAQHEAVQRVAENTRAEQRDVQTQLSSLVRQVRALRDRLDALEGP